LSHAISCGDRVATCASTTLRTRPRKKSTKPWSRFILSETVDVLIGFGTQAAIYTRLKSCKPPTEHAIRIFQVALRFYGCHSRYFRDIREANHLRKLFAVVSLFTADLFCLPGSLGVCLMANVQCKQAKRAVHKHTFTIFLPLPLRISPVYLAHFNYISV